MYCGFLWGNPLSRRTSRRGVEAFRQQRVREDRIRHVGSQRALLDRVRHFVESRLAILALRVGEFWRQALAVLSVWSLSGQGPEPFPQGTG